VEPVDGRDSHAWQRPDVGRREDRQGSLGS
jgi:hypothetical protein